MADKNYKSLVLCLCVMMFLASCRSTPQIPDSGFTDAEFLPLNPGASVYVIGDAKQARPILDLLFKEELNDKQARQMIDKTQTFAAALFEEKSGQLFHLAAWGNYPSSRAGLAFSFSRHWKKQRSAAGAYWYSAANRLSISMSSRQTFAAASVNDTPVPPLPQGQGVEIPEGFNEFSRGSPLSLWVTDPAVMFAGILSETGIPLRFPVQQLFVSLSEKTAEKYEAFIRLKFENASQARGMAAVFNLAGAFASGNSGSIIGNVFFANAPVQDGLFLNIKTAQLSESDLSLLFGLFLVN
ncbi:MAG: hypothetical protein LBI12_01180 [Treponema sp.]|jgi:hypothetical protein|nr:hypothetical protein [Treponema sp.]